MDNFQNGGFGAQDQDDFASGGWDGTYNDSSQAADDWGEQSGFSGEWNVGEGGWGGSGAQGQEQAQVPAQGNGDWDSIADTSGTPDVTLPTIRAGRVNLGYKAVGIIVAVVLVVIVMVVLAIGKLGGGKSGQQGGTAVQQAVGSGGQQQASAQQQPAAQQPTQQAPAQSQAGGGNGLVDIPPTMKIDYSGKVMQSQGQITALPRYLQDGQVVYCVEVSIQVGTSSTSMRYYCGYNVYKQLNVGDIVTVEYQQVSDTCFSVNTILK